MALGAQGGDFREDWGLWGLSSPCRALPWGHLVTVLVPGHPAAPWGCCGAGRCLMGLYSLLQPCLPWTFPPGLSACAGAGAGPCPLSPWGHGEVTDFIFMAQTRPEELLPPPAGQAKGCQSEELSSSSAREDAQTPPAPPSGLGWSLPAPWNPSCRDGPTIHGDFLWGCHGTRSTQLL